MTVKTGGKLWNPSHPQTVYDHAIDPHNPGAWRLIEDNTQFRRYELDMPDGWIVQKTEHKGTERLLEDNKLAYDASDNRKWGNGDIIGSVPLDLYFSSGLAEAARNKDFSYQKKWWDKSENRQWRKRKGSL